RSNPARQHRTGPPGCAGRTGALAAGHQGHPEGTHRSRRGSPESRRAAWLAPVTSAISRRTAAPAILLVEDKDSLRTMLRLALEGQDNRVSEARDEAEAVAAMQASRPGVVLSDLRLPKGDGLGILRAAKELDPELPVIVMTAFGSIQDAVAA